MAGFAADVAFSFQQGKWQSQRLLQIVVVVVVVPVGRLLRRRLPLAIVERMRAQRVASSGDSLIVSK